MSIIYASFCLYSNVTSQDCNLNKKCLSDGFNTLAVVNKENNNYYLSVQAYLALAYIIVVIVCFHYLRAQARMLEQ
jgi:hypothetical protein